MGYDSRGGIKSIDFSSAELERAGAGLDACAASLGEAALVLGAPGLSIPAAVLGTVTLRFRLLEAQREFAALLFSSLRLTAEAAALALKVATARGVYELAEARASAEANRAGAGSLGWLLLWDLAGPNRRPGTLATEGMVGQPPRWLDRLAFLMPGPAGLVAGFLLPMLREGQHGGPFDDLVARRLYPLLGQEAIDAEQVRVGPVEVDSIRTAAPEELAPGLGGLMELQERAEQAPPGSLLITTLPTDAGPLHIVTIPGTQGTDLFDPARLPLLPGRETGLPLRQNPWDAGGIVESLGMGSQHTALAVQRALGEAGALKGERVILSGYSQGGIHAANLAGDPRIAGPYSVQYVFSAGSPVAGIEFPESVRGLHLEDRGDPVPGADGAPNPDLRNRVTVTFEGNGGGGEGPVSVFGPAHRLRNYAELSAGGDPAVDEAVGALGALFVGAGAATVRTVQLRRAGTVPVMRSVPPAGSRRNGGFRRDWAPGP